MSRRFLGVGIRRGIRVGASGGGNPGPTPSSGEIWLAFGDSETAGRGVTAFPSGLVPADGSALTWDWGTSTFVNAQPINSQQATGSSPWAIFAALRAQQIGAPVGVINAGVGGSKTEHWLKGAPGYVVGSVTYNLYADAVAAANAAIAANPSMSFSGFLCYIGANDAVDTPPVYQANMTSIIGDLRADITGAAGKPVRQVVLPDGTPNNAALVSWQDVRTQQAALAGAVSNVSNVQMPNSTRWIGLSTDYLVHADTQGNWVVAWQLADLINGGSGAEPSAMAPSEFDSLAKHIDAGSGVTTPGGAVSQVVDAQDGEVYSQANAADQPTHTHSLAALNNQPAITFVDDFLQAPPGSLSSARFMHDGSGATVVFVLDDGVQDANEYLLLTSNSATQAGFRITRSATEIRMAVLNGSGFYAQCPIPWTSGAGKSVVIFQLQTGRLRGMKGTQWTWTETGTYTGSPSSGDQLVPLRFGGQGALEYQGSIGEIPMFAAFLDDFQLFRLMKFIRTKYNIGWVA